MLVEALDADFVALIEGRAPRGLTLADGGVGPPAVLEMLRGLAGTIRPGFAPAAWMIVRDGEIVGLCSVVKPPAGGSVDIGYGIADSRQKRGFASLAVGEVLDWARGDDRVAIVTAETSIDNPASQRVLERNGFHRIGTRDDDEDGALICWSAAVG
ncbi:MAG: GNAT family N-acetyltransferase [Brevundimonas sp.]